jgi:hypothetical protein
MLARRPGTAIDTDLSIKAESRREIRDSSKSSRRYRLKSVTATTAA